MMNIPQDPKLQKELAEEHQREILEDIEADKLAEGELPADEYKSDDYQPVTGEKDELVPTRRENRHVHKD
ncbi:MAG: hypothetical protein ABI690_23535 [Chloroflexota bacterium]